MASTIGFSSSIFRYSHSLSFSSTLHYSAGKRNSRRSILAFFGDNAAEKSRGTARLAMQWGINTTLRNLMKRERRGCKNCRNGAPARGADEADEEELALGVLAEEQESNDGDNNGIFETITSFLDPNETTKSGKILPKSYLKSAREVVKTLRESLKEESTDMAKFRKSADAAKESIREYLGGWQGKESVAKEESYVALEKAIRSLATFYSKAGPFATLPEEIKHQILDELNKAEAFL